MTDWGKPAPQSHARERLDALPPASTSDPLDGPRAELARAIPRRRRVSTSLGLLLALGFAILIVPSVTAERWLGAFGVAKVERGKPAPITVRVPQFAGYRTQVGHTGGGGVLIARGEIADRDAAIAASEIDDALPHGAVPYFAFLLLVGVLAALFTHHTRRSTHGRLLRVQLVSLAMIVGAAVIVKIVMLTTQLSVLVVPVAVFALVPTLVLDRIVGLATGTLAALVVSFLVPFDVSVAILLMVSAAASGLVVAERPKKRLRAVLTAGAAATLFTAATYPLMLYLTAGRLPLEELKDPMHSAWLAATLGPAIATALAVVLVPIYQLLVGEITHGKLVELEDLSHPLLKQISDKSPGTWQHSLTMANMAEIAANAIGANGRLVRVGAYFHDLGKSLQPKYFIENLEPGETSPHDKLPPETSCDAIFAHVSEGIVTARKAGLHERIIDFMHMHHGNGVLEYFWARAREQGNPQGLTVEHFRYPGVPPQSRETAILSICDAVEAAARTLKKPEVSAIDNLVQRIVYGKLHLGQLDESGLSMGDLRRVAESLRETIRHANHGRIEYPWQKAEQDASASPDREKLTQTGPRLDSLDRPARPESVAAAAPPTRTSDDALAATDSAGATPKLRPPPRDSSELATRTTAPVFKADVSSASPANSAARTRENPKPSRDAAVAGAWRAEATMPGRDLSADLVVPAGPMASDEVETQGYPRQDLDDIVELHDEKPRIADGIIGTVKLAELAASAMPDPQESDPRMRRVTNPLDEKRPSAEAMQFAAEAKDALDQTSKSVGAMPDPDGEPAHARKKAATLPPIRPPTIPPPLGKRPPPLPSQPPNLTVPPPSDLRPPAPAQVPLPGMTAPPPLAVRPPAPNLLDDMITLRPQYEPRGESGEAPRGGDDSARTQPRMAASEGGDETSPNLELPLRAPASSPVIPVPEDPSPWTRGLKARFDKQLDDDFGTDTPISAPTRAELQALTSSPPDPTRQQSVEEIEALHLASLNRPSEPELFVRRPPLPTAEVDEADIEAAIEIAPPARRTVIGVAKKKPTE